MALLATLVLVGTFTYECVGLTGAIERLAEATRQSNVTALRRPPPPAPVSPAPAAPAVPRPMPSPRALQASFASEYRSAIIRENETTFLIDHRLVEAVLEDQASLMRSARMVPAFVDGRSYVRLFGVSPFSLLGMLGFQNGDCLESINGFDLSTPELALEAYARLRTADVLEARVRRGRKDVTLVYELW
jgi:general secretion pathway protein C